METFQFRLVVPGSRFAKPLPPVLLDQATLLTMKLSVDVPVTVMEPVAAPPTPPVPVRYGDALGKPMVVKGAVVSQVTTMGLPAMKLVLLAASVTDRLMLLMP